MDPVLTPLPSGPVAAGVLTGSAPIVVLAPHPDDESLACGGLLAHAFAHRGAQVVCMTDGSASHPHSRDWPPDRLAARRRVELVRAVRCLGGGAGDVTWLGHPDGWLGAQDQHATACVIMDICRTRGARHLFAPTPRDHHQDHKSTARIAGLVAVGMPDLILYHYPVWSRWDDPDLMAQVAHHAPVTFDTIAAQDAKRAAIAAHASQRGTVVGDNPAGFVMSDAFVEFFINQPEVYWRAPA
jgi:LmbE family N-acetylglucosaminyl deacetylase